MKLHRWLVAAAVLVAGSQVVGQSARTLTLEAIYDPASRVNFSGVPLPDVEWLDDNRYIVAQRTARGAEWVKVDAASGKSTPLFDTDRLGSAIAALPNAGRAEARLLARSGDLTLDPTKTAALLEIADDLYVYSFEKNALSRLTSKPGEEQ